jgi:hypothetical protein
VSKFEADYVTNMTKVTDAWKAKHAGTKTDDHGHDHSEDGHQH